MSHHGGNIYEIEREKLIDKNQIIDFSSNINPFGISNFIKFKLIDNIDSIVRYPDPDYIELKQSIAAYYKISSYSIIVGNGGIDLIYLIARALQPEKVLIISPTFLEYEQSLNNNCSKIDFFLIDEKDDFELNIKKLKIELSKSYNLVIICNPNNPTGNFYNLEKIKDIANKCSNNNSFLMIDESFIDFIPGSHEESSANLLNTFTNIILLKSLTKFFAIPGLRLGFAALANLELRKKIESIREPWSVNILSETAGINLFKDHEYIDKTINHIETEKQFLYEEFKNIKELKVFKSSANFLLIKILNNISSSILRDSLINNRILIRDASNFKFLNEKFFRIAIKNRKDNKYLLEKLSLILNN